jgi:uncharacterized protein (DUF2062 family)
MNAQPANDPTKHPLRAKIKSKIKHWAKRTKALNGEPRYVAMGMAVGIFISATPTIPFQTIVAVALAFIMRGSKAAAALGVWLSNPITFPVFYLASYKIGAFLFGISAQTGIAGQSTSDLLKLGFDISIAAITGGIIIGIILATGAYIFTYKIVQQIRSREKRRKRGTCDGPRPVEDRKQKAPITAPADPECAYSTAILCQAETKDRKTNASNLLRRDT